jgi:pyruvate dehydrogenase E2 component (dihydrolipoamide acetyltransferase)
MRQDIIVPRVSESTEEGVLVTWFVEPGASVHEGDLVAEVQVEKMSAEVRAAADGTIELLVEPGGLVVQGRPIAVLDTDGRTAAATPAPEPAAAAAIPTGEAPSPPAEAPSVEREVIPGGTVAASPIARRLARELGVDLSTVTGTGPDGRIVEADVRAAATRGPAVTPAATKVEPITPMRRVIAQRLRDGLLATAQLTLTAEADVTRLGDALAYGPAGRRLSWTAAVVRAVALALGDHPRVAATWTDAGLRPADSIDVGVAVALDDGLIAVVIRDVPSKDLERIDDEIGELAERARSARLAEAESQGAVFTVTNLGGHRIDAFTPLLDPPQSAILGVGRARERPAVVDGAIVARTLVVLSLTVDHRVVDGAPAAAFLNRVVALLEDPGQLR